MSQPPQIPWASKPTLSSQSAPRTPHRPMKPPPMNAVYYPNYRVYRGDTPAKLNLSYITHIFYAFAYLRSDGTVFLSDEWADCQMDVDGAKGCLGSLRNIQDQYPDISIILSIGGGGASEHFAAVAADHESRERFGQSARALVDTYRLSGIDIDWEHPSTPAQGQHFIALLHTIRTHLPDAHYLLTAALPAGEWALQNIPLAQAADYLDFINLMAYDFSGSWTTTANHHAQLYMPAHSSSEPSGDAAASYVLSTGVPPEKVILGIPAYGRSFLHAQGPGDKYAGHGGEEGTFEYKDLPRPGARVQRDERCVACWSVGGDGGLVSYDDAVTVGIKGRYCLTRGLGGLFYWTGTADVTGPHSLIEAGFRALHAG